MITKKTTLAVLASTLFAGSALAATDGTLGEDSTGSLNIDFTVGDEHGPGKSSILIQKLDDMTLGSFIAGDQKALEDFSNFCVYRTGSPTGVNFNITATSTKGGTAFQLHKTGLGDGTTPTDSQKVGYGVTFSSNADDAISGALLPHGTSQAVSADTSVALTESASGYECAGENVSIRVKADVTTASKAEAGAYSDTLTLLVSPR